MAPRRPLRRQRPIWALLLVLDLLAVTCLPCSAGPLEAVSGAAQAADAQAHSVQPLPSPAAAPADEAAASAADQDSPQVTMAGQGLGPLPGSLLYNIKLLLERIRLWLFRSSEGKANYMVELINRRSAEIAELVRSGRSRFIEKAARDQEKLIRQVQDRVGQLGIESEDLGLLDRVEEAVGRAWDTLAGALGGLPEKAQGAVNGIMQRVSQRARQFWDDLDKAIRGTGQGTAKDILERLRARRNWHADDKDNEGKEPQGK